MTKRAAHQQGCTCRMSFIHSASIDPPHEIVDQWCPLHGRRDPDRELEAERDDKEFFASMGWDDRELD